MRPWWADGAWEFVARRLRKDSKVFEWGSGNSTICISKICKIISIENDQAWHDKLKGSMPSNVTLIFIPDDGPTNKDPADIDGFSSASKLFYKRNFTKYAKEIDRYGPFDLVIVDGRSRTSCLARAISKVKKGGMLLLDDPWREHYKPAIKLIPPRWNKHEFHSVEHHTTIWTT